MTIAAVAATLLGGLVVPGSPATATATASSVAEPVPRVASQRAVAEPRVVQTQDPADGTALAVVAMSAYRRDVFARSAQNTLLHRSYAGGRWSDWVDRGGSISSAPAVASWGSGRLDVFARGTDNKLWHLWFTDGAWSNWEVFDAGLTSAPAVASWGPGRLDVFVRGGGNNLFHLYFDGGWSRWANLGGGLTSAPTAAAWGPGQLHVFLRGGSNHLFQIFGDGRGAWSGWVGFGGNLESAPAVTSWGLERFDVFARGTDDTLLHKWFDQGWSDLITREGPLTSAPAVAAPDVGELEVFGLDGDGAVHQRGGPQPWGPWHGLMDDPVPGQDPGSSGEAPTALAHFRLDEKTGDTAANGFPTRVGPNGTLRNGPTWDYDTLLPPVHGSQGSVKLDGVDDHVSTPVVVATDQSFTVAAWVKVATVDRGSVVVSQDGSRVSGFYLKVDKNDRWVFGIPGSDTEGAGWNAAYGPKATAGEWTHLVGVYDATAGEIRLYVNGVKVGVNPHRTPWKAAGGLQLGRGMWAGNPADHLPGNLDDVRAWQGVMPGTDISELVVAGPAVREDRCVVGHWLHAGGPAVKAEASAALAGTDYDRRRVLQTVGWGAHDLEWARRTDDATYLQSARAQGDRYGAWGAVIDPYTVWGDDFITFHDVPEYGEATRKFLLERNDTTFNTFFKPPAPPRPSQAAVDRALTIAAEMRAAGARWPPQDSTVRSMTAVDIDRFIRYGGWPTVAPTRGSAEYRMEVEETKAVWAGCETDDPNGADDVLADVVATAKAEWNAELAAQAKPRNDIVSAEVQAMLDVRTASAAMIEAQGQAWVAGQLLTWQKYWQGRPKSDLHYPRPELFPRANQDLATARDRVAAQLAIVRRAAASAKSRAVRVTAAQAEAAAIAKANGTPMYRGLAYAQQSAQVAKASAAAAQAASKAVEATLAAVRATNADSKALQSLALTQQAGLQAEFHRIAAQEAAAQARAAAVAGREQADRAAAAATRAKNARARAEKAEGIARVAAAVADRQRVVAEKERDNAVAARKLAEAERAKAGAAEDEARRHNAVATGARGVADASAATATEEEAAAAEAEGEAREARDAAVIAERRKDAAEARVRSTEAIAAAAVGTAHAGDARAAADAAKVAAGQATEAASSARAAADRAGQAAVAARAAATKATAAAQRSQAGAEGAEAAYATTYAQSVIAHAAAAEAIDAAKQAADNVKAAEEEARKAAAAAVTARQEADAAQVEADKATAESATTAGHAYAAAEAAIAARDAATAAIAPANEAIVLGTPFRATDASAGMAVLVGQAAKSLAEQQASAAEAKANEAARAAQTAKDTAAKANADAKAAAEAAATAATDAASAAEAVKQARASAAAAAKDAEAAKRADVNTATYNRQAQTDAITAKLAAQTATNEAQRAEDAATEAEQDAESARGAATTAESQAAAARDSATEADQSASRAEELGANARGHAEEADQAATRAEEQERRDEEARRAEALSGDGEAPGGGGVTLTLDDEEILRQNCGQSCVDEYRQGLSDASKTVMQWVRQNGVEVLVEVIGYADLERCFTTGNVESCLWTLVNAIGAVVLVAKLPAVSAAIVRVGTGVTRFLTAATAGRQAVERLRKVIDRVRKANPPCTTASRLVDKHRAVNAVRATAPKPCPPIPGNLPVRKPAGMGTSARVDYAKTFTTAYPAVKGKVVVHHAVERQVMKKYPGVFTWKEMHSLENLRGIPKDINSDLHLRKIRDLWKAFYTKHPTTATRKEILDYATYVDDVYGDMFTPRIR